MKRFWVCGCLLYLLVALAWLPACDSDDNGGGGGTEGYTQSMLTGVWNFRLESNGNVLPGEMEFDAAGHLLRFEAAGPVVTNPSMSNVRGKLVVYPDGRVEGTITNVINLPPSLVAASTSVYRLRFKADGTISGKRASKLVQTMGGVVVATITQNAKLWLTKK